MTSGIELVFETHALTVDNENGVATGWLRGILSANRDAVGRPGSFLEPLEEVVTAPFDWREGWEYGLRSRPLAAGLRG